MRMDIRAIRKGLGLSQSELADKLGLTQPTISRFETGGLELDERTRLAVEALAMKRPKGATPARKQEAA